MAAFNGNKNGISKSAVFCCYRNFCPIQIFFFCCPDITVLINFDTVGIAAPDKFFVGCVFRFDFCDKLEFFVIEDEKSFIFDYVCKFNSGYKNIVIAVICSIKLCFSFTFGIIRLVNDFGIVFINKNKILTLNKTDIDFAGFFNGEFKT